MQCNFLELLLYECKCVSLTVIYIIHHFYITAENNFGLLISENLLDKDCIIFVTAHTDLIYLVSHVIRSCGPELRGMCFESHRFKVA